MGQKTNPNIFQLTKTNNWQSKCFEKKIAEYSIYPKKDIEIRNFIQKFFKDHGRIIHQCKLCYLEKSLHIFVSYHLNLNLPTFTKDNIPEIYAIEKKKYTNKETTHKKILLPYLNLKSKILNSHLKQVIRKKNQNHKKKLKIKIIKPEKPDELSSNFMQKFSDSLTNFTLKKFKLVIQLKSLNTALDTSIKIKANKFFKKKLVNLRKYEQTDFFKTGINTLFTCAINHKSSKLLAQFIAIQLKNVKRHNFFFKFIKNTLTLLSNNTLSKFKGIKIKIKGRLNGRPRARSQDFKIANDVSVLTIDSTIDYSEETAFTPNGTLGIKVWIHELKN
jgi:ribosomal protein S3